MSWIHSVRGHGQGKRFEIDKPRITVGRDNSNSIQIPDPEISRVHAEIRENEEGAHLLVDADSSNGTFVNGIRVTEHPLVDGDVIRVGQTLVVYSCEPVCNYDYTNDVSITSFQDEGSGARFVESMDAEVPLSDSTDAPLRDKRLVDQYLGHLQLMYQVSQATSRITDINELTHVILELVFDWIEADRDCLMLIDGEEDEIVPRATRHRSADMDTGRIQISRTILDYVRDRKEGVLITDAQSDDRLLAAKSVYRLGIREAICVPMQGPQGTIGFLYVDTFLPNNSLKPNEVEPRFETDHLKMTMAIGHQAALAIENNRYYTRLLERERLAGIGQTAAVLSHHTRNILQGLQNGGYLIEQGLEASDFEFVSAGWRVLERNLKKTSKLITDMLTFSKDRQPDLRNGDLNEVISEVLDNVLGRARQEGVEIDCRTAQCDLRAQFDPEAMQHAVLNLVQNAIDACAEVKEPRITIAAQRDENGNRIRIEIQDNGVGISPQDCQHVFDVFVSSKGHRGTGLGLSVSLKILQEHGGEIEVDSEVGRGSCFTLILPIKPEFDGPRGDGRAAGGEQAVDGSSADLEPGNGESGGNPLHGSEEAPGSDGEGDVGPSAGGGGSPKPK